MTIREFFRNHFTPLRALSFLVFVVSITIGITLLWTHQRQFFGEMHAPHDDLRTIHLKPNREYRQTFTAEGRSVEGVLFLVDTATAPSGGVVSVEADNGSTSTSGTVSTTDIFSGGELYIPFSPALPVKRNALVTLRITGTADVDLRYQIDGNKYKAGSLSLFVPNTDTPKTVAGDLAFQVRYHSPAADILHLSLPSTIGIAFIAVFSWFVFLWLLSQPPSQSKRLTFVWERADIWALLSVIIIVGGVYGLALFPHISWWSTNGDYVKDVIYLRSAVEHLQAHTFPAWQMNMCGGQPLLGNPEGNVGSFGIVLAALLGPVVGMKIFLWLEVLLAAIGAYILGRMFGLAPMAAMFPALVFTLSGFIPNRAQTATMFVAGAAAVPWMLVTFMQSLHRPRWLLPCAAVTVVAFLAGDTHVIIYALIAISVISVVYTIRDRRIQPLVLLGSLCMFLLLMGAVKLLPSFEGQSHYNGKQYPPLVVLLTKHHLLDDVFLSRAIDHPPGETEHGNPEGWNNIGLYTGILPLLLGVIGMLVTPKHARPVLLTLMGAFFVLGEGTLYEIGLLKLGGEIRSLFRIPSRSLIVLILALGLTGGYVIDWLIGRWRMIGVGISLIVLLIITIDLGTFTFSALRVIEHIPPAASNTAEPVLLTAQPAHLMNSDSHPLRILDDYAAVGSTCPDFNNTPSFIKDTYEGPLVTAMAGNPLVTRVTPQQLHIIPASVPSVLHAHLVFSPLLTVTGGIPQSLPDGSFEILVPRTSSAVDITYRSHVALAGLVTSVGTLGSGILLCIPQRKEKTGLH